MKYYDGTKLLSLKDLEGNPPELYIVTTNRSGGKTTYFGRLCVNRYLKFKEKFALIYRYNYELDDCAEKFFKDIGSLFFPTHEMCSKRKASGIFHELFLDDVSCGYALSLNSADQLKKYSHLFSDVQRCIFDEFQSESGHYCSDEIRKFISVHTSIARGQGVQSRYVPVFMLGNSVSIINPYYTELGISNRLRSDTTYLRGVGYVLEQGYVESAANAQKNSNFNRAFSANKYTAYSSENVYLNDSKAFIEKPTGKSRYVCTIKYNGNHYGIREYAERGMLYVDDVADASYRLKIVVNSDDHEKNYIMLKRNDAFLILMRKYFEKGCFRFKNMNAKSALLAALSY